VSSACAIYIHYLPNVCSRDAKSSFNFEREDSITSTVWHSDVSYELQPPGLTTFFLLSQPTTGGDTLFTSQISTLRKLSPSFVAFLRTLSAVHSGVEQAEFSRSGKRGGIVRREPVEHVHPVVRRHPVTGEEALYVNRQFTKRIVGLKREESGASGYFVVPQPELTDAPNQRLS
jgi:sulfonate dioxygenase